MGYRLNHDLSTNKKFYGYEKIAFAICKYEPTISAKRMLIGLKTIVNTSLVVNSADPNDVVGIKFTMR